MRGSRLEGCAKGREVVCMNKREGKEWEGKREETVGEERVIKEGVGPHCCLTGWKGVLS